jgi:hypothetical protein
MRYFKVIFVALLPIASAVSAADVPNTRQIASFIGTNLPEVRIQFAKKGTTADLAREILSQVTVPTGAEIVSINLGAGMRGQSSFDVGEDIAYNVDFSPYQPNKVIVYLKIPSLTEVRDSTKMGTVQIRDNFLNKDTTLVVPERGKVIDIMNAYKQKVTIPDNVELFALFPEGGFRMMRANDPYTTENLSNIRIRIAYKNLSRN